MDGYHSTIDFDTAAQLIRKTDGMIMALTHTKPDGDAFGSTVALVAALRTLGKDARACFVPPVPVSLGDMHGAELVQVCDEPAAVDGEAELYIILDTGAWSQLGPAADLIRPKLDRTLVIDHHLAGDIEARYRLIDGKAAACCEIIAPIIDRLLQDQGGLDKASHVIRDALFVGIASDTGWFCFSNTRPATHELAARLLRLGVDHSDLYRRLEQMERPEKLTLLIRALDSLQLLAGGKAAMMVLRGEDFAESGAMPEETERLIDVPQQVGTIQVIAMLSEQMIDDGQGDKKPLTRMSFRSKPGKEAINVSELAAKFGGGGHARAAGAKVEKPVEQVAEQVAEAINELMGAGSSA